MSAGMWQSLIVSVKDDTLIGTSSGTVDGGPPHIIFGHDAELSIYLTPRALDNLLTALIELREQLDPAPVGLAGRVQP